MQTKQSLEHIKKFVEEKTNQRFSNYINNKEILKVKKMLEEKSSKEEKKFTFTVGDVNAYLG